MHNAHSTRLLELRVSALLTVICVLLQGQGCIASQIESNNALAFVVVYSSLEEYDGIYTCVDNVCSNVDNRAIIQSSNHFVNNSIQKRWYIIAENNSQIFGAVETSHSPWTVRRWKRLGSGFEFGMRVSRINKGLCSVDSLTEWLETEPSTSHNVHAVLRGLLLSLMGEGAEVTVATLGCADILVQILNATINYTVQFSPSSLRVDLISALCEWVEVAVSWSAARPCYSFLALSSPLQDATAPSSTLIKAFVQYLNIVHTRFISPLLPSTGRQSLTAFPNALDYTPMKSCDITNHLPSLPLLCLSPFTVSGKVEQAQEGLETLLGAGRTFGNGSCCLWRHAMMRYANGLLREDLDVSGALSAVRTVGMGRGCWESVLMVLDGTDPMVERDCVHDCDIMTRGETGVYGEALQWACFILRRGLGEGVFHDYIALASSVMSSGMAESAARVTRKVILNVAGKHDALKSTSSAPFSASQLSVFCKTAGAMGLLLGDEKDIPCYNATLFSDRGSLGVLLSILAGANGDMNEDIWEILRGSEHLLTLYISMVLQILSPTITSPSDDSTPLRQEADFILKRIAERCEIDGCTVDLSALSPAVKGLFLLAYQESTISTLNSSGWSIPNSYYRIVVGSESFQSEKEMALKSTTAANNAKIRVAFLSSFFFRHSVGRLLGHTILTLNRDVFHLTIIDIQAPGTRTNGLNHDDLTYTLRKAADDWVTLNMDVISSGRHVKGLYLDIIIFGDILMDSHTTHIAMHRMAPTQIAFWGHPYSPGFPSIDYFVTSESFEPSMGSMTRKERGYFEQLVLFQSLSANFLPADSTYSLGPFSRAEYISALVERGRDIHNRPFRMFADTLSLHDHAERSKFRIYSCLQSLMKFHSDFDDILANIVLRDPKAIIVLSSSMHSKPVHQALFQQRLWHKLLATGADDRRVVFIPQGPSQDYNNWLCGSDVSLDPVPFGGGVTLSDALRCDVPFVSSGAMQTVHRIGNGIAAHINISAMIADGAEDYVRKAVQLANSSFLCRNVMEKDQWVNDGMCRTPTHQQQSCEVWKLICENKGILFPDLYGAPFTSSVTSEWESFLQGVYNNLR